MTLPPAASSEPFKHVVRTRWFDLDALGHVNNAIFLTYIEEARDTWFTERLGNRNVYVVVRIEVDFLKVIGADDRQVTVEISPERLGNKSITSIETLLDEAGAVAARAKTTSVRWDPGLQQTVAFTAAERDALMK